MKIKVFVKAGYLSIECEGVLPEPPRKIVLDRQTRVFTFFFRKLGKKIEFDCPMDDEMLAAVKNNKICGIGCFDQGKRLSAALVPFVLKPAT